MLNWIKELKKSRALSPRTAQRIKLERIGYTERELKGFLTHWSGDPPGIIDGIMATINRRLEGPDKQKWIDNGKAADYEVKREQLEVLKNTADPKKALGE